MSAEHLVRAAQYVRMSTDHQKYSTENQSEANHLYAASRRMEIVRTYADAGKSGLRLAGREALERLILDVQSGSADFTAILVYDVSRWGRFQDADESAHYEYVCKRAGISVHYCAEQFENDGSPFAAIVKSIKRAMAAEYSRELSIKVFAGQSRLVKLGYNQSSMAPFGLRRMLVDQDGAAKGILSRGQYKSISTDRVIIVPGPLEQIRIVRWIFRSFVRDKRSEKEIARILNRRGIRNSVGGPWRGQSVHRVLSNEKYIGNNVWNRTSGKLKGKRRQNAPETWIRADGAFTPVVARPLFDAAQSIMRDRAPGLSLSQDQKLEPLRRLLRKHGYINSRLIGRTEGVPSVATYTRWFGGLFQAYRLVGFVAPSERWFREGVRRNSAKITRGISNEQLLQALRELLQRQGFLTMVTINRTEGVACAATYQHRFGSLSQAYNLIGYAPKGSRKRPKLSGPA